MRVWRYIRFLWQARDICFRSPIVWHDVRALWIQSDPHWMLKIPWAADDEAEAEAILEILDEIDAGTNIHNG